MKRLSGFSLMEMMIVLTIVAIVAAASAPMVNRKMVKSATEQQSLWSLINNGPSIGFNFNQNDGAINTTTVNIGGIVPSSAKNPKLYINTPTTSSTDATSHISFGANNENIYHLKVGGKLDNVLLSNNIPDDSSNGCVLIGKNVLNGKNCKFDTINNIADTYKIDRSLISDNAKDVIAIGTSAQASGTNSIAIGDSAMSAGGVSIGYNTLSVSGGVAIADSSGSYTTANSNGIAIGTWAHAGINGVSIGYRSNANAGSAIAIGEQNEAGKFSIAIGTGANATATDEIESTVAIGTGAKANGSTSVAIGPNAKGLHKDSVAIGHLAQTENDNEIVLGTSTETVVIPGNLVVKGEVALATTGKRVWINAVHDENLNQQNPGIICWSNKHGHLFRDNTSFANFYENYISDRRLKNVGEHFKAGLAEIKKLEVFNYTFKDDKDKTPRVGVMAQDLKKIFPKAVTKGEDGFLRIRMEDMFYALVNAVKELDDILTGQNKRIEELEKQNKELQNTIDILEKRLHALEKNKA